MKKTTPTPASQKAIDYQVCCPVQISVIAMKLRMAIDTLSERYAQLRHHEYKEHLPNLGRLNMIV